MDPSTVKLVTIPLSWLIGGCSIFAGLVVAIAGIIVWLYATFITRTEAAKIEEGVQQLIELFEKVFNEKLDALTNLVNSRHYRGEKTKLKVVKKG